MKKTLLAILIFSCSHYLVANDFYPRPLLQLDEHFTHHIFVAEKSTHTLYLFQNKNGYPELLKSYQMASGKKAGDKLFQGDYRTPEGIYFLTDFLTHKDLIKRHGKKGEIYGVGAFVMDYPNPIDQMLGKTGSGIWLHSTNDETRIDKGLDSRGCLVTANKELIEMAQYIELGKTPIVVVHDLKFLTKKTWENTRNKLKDTFNNWLAAWSQEDHKKYISFYHEKFSDPRRGSLNQYSAYKKSVFNNPGNPTINAKKVFMLQSEDYAVITFIQDYQSKSITDQGRKVLFLKKDNYYNWKIISESWSKRGIEPLPNSNVAFRPSMRFFKTESPVQIMGDRLLHAKKLNESNQSNN